MKKLLIIGLIFFNVYRVSASEKIEVELSKCVDGDTANFIYNDEIIKSRFIAIDTPETKNPKKEIEPYGKEASEYTCYMLTNANLIQIEYDKNCMEKDKYDRAVIWVYVDGNLLQKKLVEKGLAKVAYLYDDYEYVDELKKAELTAKDLKLNIWSNKEYINLDYKEYIIIAILGLIFIITGSKWAKRNFKKRVRKKISQL